jgi:hypothetical protein
MFIIKRFEIQFKQSFRKKDLHTKIILKNLLNNIKAYIIFSVFIFCNFSSFQYIRRLDETLEVCDKELI